MQARPARSTKKLSGTIDLSRDPRAAKYQQQREHVDLALLRFVSRRNAISKAHPKKSSTWPDEMSVLWTNIIERLDEGLDPDGEEALSRRVLIRARVMTEAEFEMTTRQFGPQPDIEKRLLRTHGVIAWHMRNKDIRTRGVEPRGTGQEIVWPVSPVLITSTFGHRRDPIHDEVRFHSGLDLGGRTGDLVFSAGPGVVIHAGWHGGYGRMVVVQHRSGYQSVYAHLDGILVPDGVQVDAGSPLGMLGSSGRSTGPHLHFEMRKHGTSIDPLDLIGRPLPREVVARLAQ